ncbi:MAG: hypothetical protein M0D55_08660 [Elusimicrobiota bacterium]|nr:MAG: hypothetical protein M0D55_08660 [Elusimicrobiota bacterium]
MKGPVEFFLQFERTAFVNRRAVAHEYKGGFLWDLGRTGFGVALRRYDSGVYRPSDGLTLEWRLKLR